VKTGIYPVFKCQFNIFTYILIGGLLYFKIKVFADYIKQLAHLLLISEF